jgi:hypothetical protein
MAEQTDDTVDIKDSNLNDFENLLFNDKQEAAEEVKEEIEESEEEVDENEDDSLATENDDNDEAEEDGDEDEDLEPEDKPKRRNRAQERIEKLVADVRVTERERDAERREKELLLRQLEELRTGKTEVKQVEDTSKLPPNAPQFDAVDKEGNPLYPLGEYDGLYIRDLTRFVIEEETKAHQEKLKQADAESKAEAARTEIQTRWNSNLEKYEAEVPEVRENIANLVDTFSELEPNYGEYLASTIMDSEFGPQIMDYFSQNIGEAQKIVASGPAAATRAIGRLEAKFITPTNHEDEKRNKKVSDAPPPPPKTKGTAVAKTIRPDTPNLDDFEKIFYTT